MSGMPAESGLRGLRLARAKLAAIAAWLLIIDQNWGEMDAQQGHETDRIRKIIDATTMAELEALAPSKLERGDA